MKTPSPFARVVLGAVSACIVVFGIMAMVVSPLMAYRNYWGGMVFGPFAIIVGSLLLVVLAFFPERLSRLAKNSRRSKRRY